MIELATLHFHPTKFETRPTLLLQGSDVHQKHGVKVKAAPWTIRFLKPNKPLLQIAAPTREI
jgi:hypothetical protein